MKPNLFMYGKFPLLWLSIAMAFNQQEPSLAVQDETMAWAHMRHHVQVQNTCTVTPKVSSQMIGDEWALNSAQVENGQMTTMEGSTVHMDSAVMGEEGLFEVLVECIEQMSKHMGGPIGKGRGGGERMRIKGLIYF
ncbi:hypothetical protein VNO78_30395 [Psophocarpus tetragonolobus]|uniref:Uncharacterized protein n=1 Tax=Psophocarpus tetragonolobus TaxID=3891 RepID=A0AAN9RWI7_PSOTE